MLSKKFIDMAYKTKGNELCKYVRAEVMEQIEMQELEDKFTEDGFNSAVNNIMNRIKTMVEPMIEIEVKRCKYNL